MSPITFNRCFGWLHYAPGSRGVVMCSPFGYEELGTHRGWYELANSIAAAGRPTLRFDYEGINDSLGVEDDPNRIETWIQNIVDAVSYLKASCGVTEVALVGLRFGALLAALAAERMEGVDQMVLFAPVIYGRNYVRELKLAAESWWASASPSSHQESSSQYLDIIGDRLYKETLEHISKLKIDKVAAKKILLIDQGSRSDINKFYETASTTQDDIVRYQVKDIDLFLRDAILTVHPLDAFDAIVHWLGDGGLKSNIVPNSINSTPTVLATASYVEESVKFGPEDKLFGILTKSHTPSLEYPAVIILNTGPNHHVGNGRLSVTLARRLAAFGITTIRFDLAGIGDSGDIPGRQRSTYSDEAKDDVKHVLSLMKGYSPKGCVVLGLCSGAFLGFHSAVSEQSIVGAVIVNLQRFIWTEGTSLTIGGRKVKRSTRFYLKAVQRRATWIKIIKGEANVFVTGKVLGQRFLRKLASKCSPIHSYFDSSNEPKTKVFDWVKQLSDRNVKTRLWYSDDDPGLVELEEYFGTFGRKIIDLPNVSIDVLGGADHSLNSHAARIQFISMFEKFMHESFKEDMVTM